MIVRIADPIKLVRDFLSLPMSQRRFIAERYGVIRSDPMEPDIERDKRTIAAVVEQGKQVEFAMLVGEASRADGQSAPE